MRVPPSGNRDAANDLRQEPSSVSVFCQCHRDGDCHSLSLHDPRLQQLIAAWDQMPEHVKLTIEALCRMPAR